MCNFVDVLDEYLELRGTRVDPEPRWSYAGRVHWHHEELERLRDKMNQLVAREVRREQQD